MQRLEDGKLRSTVQGEFSTPQYVNSNPLPDESHTLTSKHPEAFLSGAQNMCAKHDVGHCASKWYSDSVYHVSWQSAMRRISRRHGHTDTQIVLRLPRSEIPELDISRCAERSKISSRATRSRCGLEVCESPHPQLGNHYAELSLKRKNWVPSAEVGSFLRHFVRGRFATTPWP